MDSTTLDFCPNVELIDVSCDCWFLSKSWNVFPMHSRAATIKSCKYRVPLGSRQNLQEVEQKGVEKEGWRHYENKGYFLTLTRYISFF